MTTFNQTPNTPLVVEEQKPEPMPFDRIVINRAGDTAPRSSGKAKFWIVFFMLLSLGLGGWIAAQKFFPKQEAAITAAVAPATAVATAPATVVHKASTPAHAHTAQSHTERQREEKETPKLDALIEKLNYLLGFK